MSILVAAAIILAATALTCGLMFAIHRLGSKDVFLADTTRGAGVYAVAGTGFAVLLAFVVLVAYQSYNEAKAGAEKEADSMIELFRTAEFFPEAEHQALQGELICYGRAVAERDWPAMREGGRSHLVDRWVFRLQNAYEGLTVRTPKQEAAFADILSLRNDRVEGRRERLDDATPVVTTPVWFILGVGAVVNIAFVLMFIDRRNEAFAAQAALIATITIVVVSGLLLVWFLDHPYEDASGSIKPDRMREAVSIMEEEFPNVPTRCTSSGEPRPT
jgi:hypothetical protein